MHRTDADGNVDDLHVDQGGTSGTVIDADMMNAYQEELCYLIEQCGLTLNTPAEDEIGTPPTRGRTQLYEAIFESGHIGDDAMGTLTELNTTDLSAEATYGGRGIRFGNGPGSTQSWSTDWRLALYAPDLSGVTWSESYTDSHIWEWDTVYDTDIPEDCEIQMTATRVRDGSSYFNYPTMAEWTITSGVFRLVNLGIFNGLAAFDPDWLRVYVWFDADDLDLS